MPLVSCIMPTRNRRQFVGQAIWYFLRQDYSQRELIIVDDGEDSVADLVPNDERIRYRRLEMRLPLGAKRNLACEMSCGELIAHWDDDDWMAPNRLSIQVASLLAANAEACGARDLLHYRPDAGEAWYYRHPAALPSWLAGGTLLYRRSAWNTHSFPESTIGEDRAFIGQLPSERIHALTDSSFYIALLHPGNTAPKNLADPCWQRRPLDEVSRLLAFDREFYVTLRNGRPTLSVRAPMAPASVTVSAPFGISSGYGSMAEYLVLGMTRAGATVHVAPLSLRLDGMTPEFQEIIRRSRPEVDAPVLYFCWPRADLTQFLRCSELFINTMYESSRLPPNWVEQLNQARAVIVPTRFVAQVCRDSGVAVPVEVIPEGVDPIIYHYENRPDRPGITTLMVGPVDPRKHTLEGIAAWKEAFSDNPEAKLIIKTQYNFQNYKPDDPRIQYIDVDEPTRGIAHWYREADVLLALGNEGFGLPLVKGMATGLPVIALNSEGQADICGEAKDCLLAVDPSGWQTFDSPLFGPSGVRGIPSVAEVARQLRWVANHRSEGRDLGKAASHWVLQHRNIWAKGPAVLEAMERYIRPSRPLRRMRTLWVPTWRSPCGIAEYTAHLATALPSIDVTAHPPDMRGVRLLHIQHEDSIFSEPELIRCIQQAHNAGVPVAITEHTVRSHARAWERDADALVALTSHGTDMLRARWPTKRIEMLPAGCPTWFPPRKPTRGLVIGGFGFLASYKGFWQLLDILRQVSGSELVLFSHARSAELEAHWTQAAEGLPVRRVGDFLPVVEVAHRLAAEADILVFWYENFTEVSASYAIRIGLATGVPVLASPTGWFADLRDVTYQPGDLLEGVRHLLDDTGLRERLSTAAHEYCQANSWPRIAERHLNLWRTLESA
jgi:glycosyltransferase involved in cell wall biosynthesis